MATPFNWRNTWSYTTGLTPQIGTGTVIIAPQRLAASGTWGPGNLNNFLTDLSLYNLNPVMGTCVLIDGPNLSGTVTQLAVYYEPSSGSLSVPYDYATPLRGSPGSPLALVFSTVGPWGVNAAGFVGNANM
jgi:hypothetical protein